MEPHRKEPKAPKPRTLRKPRKRLRILRLEERVAPQISINFPSNPGS
jgi:hypothetical protein